MQGLAEFLTMLCAGLFAGAAAYVSLVEHPARIECGTQIAVMEFGPSYRRAALMQATLAVAGFVLSIIACLSGAHPLWLLGGTLLVLAVPYTLIVIMPTNRMLLDPSLDKNSEKAHQLLVRWGQLHAVRAILGLVAFALLLVVSPPV